jgi:hypothetical protein
LSRCALRACCVAAAKLTCAALGSLSLRSNLKLNGQTLEYSLRSPFDLMVNAGHYEKWLPTRTAVSNQSYSAVRGGTQGYALARFGFGICSWKVITSFLQGLLLVVEPFARRHPANLANNLIS